MKIALLAPDAEMTSAATRVFLKYAQTMTDNGHEVAVFFPRNAKRDANIMGKDFMVYFCPKWLSVLSPKGGFGIGEFIYKAVGLLKERYDCIHVCPGHRPANLASAILARYIRGSVIVDEWWEWFGKGGYANLRRGFLGACVAIYDSLFEVRSKYFYDGIIAITESLKQRLDKGMETIVLHGGAELDRLVDYDKAEARAKLELPEHWLIIGMSSLAKNDHDDNKPFLTAISSLFDRIPSLRLMVSGNREYIESYIVPLVPRQVLINLGWVDYEIYNLHMSACDVFVLPFPNTYRNRGRWPHRIGDYLALNRPIITNSTGDIYAYFAHYKLGRLCDNTTEAYREIITEIASKPELSCESRLVAQMLSIDKKIGDTLTFYTKLISCRQRHGSVAAYSGSKSFR